MTRAKQEMTRKVAFVLESDDLTQAYHSMQALDVRHVPVTREDKVVGILSDRDVLLHAKPGKKGIEVPAKKVADVMTRDVLVCGAEDSIASIAEVMIGHKIDALPVVDSRARLIGIITSTDLLRLLMDKDWQSELPVPYHYEKHRLICEAVN